MSLTETFGLVVTAVDQTTGPKTITGGGVMTHITGTFTATLALRFRAPTKADGTAWGTATEGMTTLATWTAATAPASDATVNTFPFWGVWQVELICTAFTSGAPMGWLGVQNQAC